MGDQQEVSEVNVTCETCGGPAVQIDGRWVHAEIADMLFCSIFRTALDIADGADRG